MPELRHIIFSLIAGIFGFILALPAVSMSFPASILSNGLSYMGIFFHEIGHTIFGWIFGIPSFPIFDFKYGGGYSLQLSNHSWPAQIAVWCLEAYGIYHFRDRIHPIALYPLAAFLILMALIGMTDFYENIILFMGHGTEAVLGGFMLARGIYGVFLTRPEERWLNVLVGAYFITNQLVFCHMLMFDIDYQENYALQKGGHGMGDLTRIANDHIGWTQNGVAIFLGAFSLFVAILIPAIIHILLRIQTSRTATY